MRAVIYFCKAPQKGKVKTRLARTLGDEKALDIYAFLLHRLFALPLHVKAFVAYRGNEDFIPPSLPRFPQEGEGLGARMRNAFLHLFAQGFTKVVLLGADIPRIDTHLLEDAFTALDSHDAVLSPTKDGGYYLIGFNQKSFTCKAFEGITYSNPDVFALTCKALVPLHVKQGAMLEDIDTLGDLRGFCADFPTHELTKFAKPILEKLPCISLIMPVFHEDESAVDAIFHAFTNAKNSDIEAIVVDTSERTCIDALVFKNPVRFHTALKGRASQLNAGFSVARGEIVLFLHADTLLPKNWDTLVQNALHVSDAGAFELSIASPSRWLRCVAWATNRRARFFGTPYGDQAHFFKASVFEHLGGYPAQPLMEDVAIMKTLKDKGFRLALLKECAATSPRRWHKEGLFYTTLRNRILSTLYALGVSPERLARWYRALRYGKK
ncbi:MAG: TIGR04283 family arsenosugar biosynthesis glycosyltransferase [Campylobacterales bacterium]|nr:TIGR04283 family arsenosugar biosynthesis glycosyltransferase [Campylobacterales bacterium]